MIVEVEHPVAGKLKMPGIPIKLSETPGEIKKPSFISLGASGFPDGVASNVLKKKNNKITNFFIYLL